ncbi:nitrogen regulation protein NR(II) [Reinekea blandensis]|uniref:Sensory histidine kinase/phosphatase NtrB n=1 Tax=Reinekea blandensis MED297 TaxID=314283 RepID=A4BFU6_9GAMM|nr:nitrogen regulation protein NR(II) [Reinekea blandensis]EAR08964.1 nitrogen regulation protein NR(II) [Reinekea sp. MED297] [Reinekea blandensis MED297]
MNDQENAFRRILDHQFTAVVVLDAELHVEHLNSSAELLLVRSEKQLIGQSFEHLFVQPDDVSQVLNTAIAEGASVSVRAAHWRLVYGENLTLDYIVSPYMDRGHLHIIVEMVPADRAVRISRDEGRVDQSETSRHLVRGLAHEIKNPLGGIRGAAQLLASELPGDELQEYTRVIIEEADRLRNLVDRLLGSHQLPEFRSLNVHQVLERVFSLMKAEAGSRINLQRDYDPSIPPMSGDEAQLIQVFLNISRNALQALTESGQSDAKLTFKTRSVRQFTIRQQRHRLVVRVDIIDNGPGIDRDLLEKIFYPMISGRASGTGLGLSIVQQFVELHHGMVECNSDPGCTTFSVYFPLEAANV